MPRSNTPAATADAPSVETMTPGEHNPFVNLLLQVAKDLDQEKTGLTDRIAANRDVLRNMAKQNLVDPEQAAAINEFYPLRARKVKSDSNGATPDAPAADAAPATDTPTADTPAAQ